MTTLALYAQTDFSWFNEQYSYWVSQLNKKDKTRYTLMKSKVKQKQMVLSRALISHALNQFNCSLQSGYEILNYNTLKIPNRIKPFSLSITHSGSIAAIILSDQSVKLGIDIEQLKTRNFAELAKEVCTKVEIILINKRNNIQNDFYKLWTVKESLAKASQSTLTALYQCDCSSTLLNETGKLFWQGDSYYFENFKYHGYIGTVVTDKEHIAPIKITLLHSE